VSFLHFGQSIVCYFAHRTFSLSVKEQFSYLLLFAHCRRASSIIAHCKTAFAQSIALSNRAKNECYQNSSFFRPKIFAIIKFQNLHFSNHDEITGGEWRGGGPRISSDTGTVNKLSPLRNLQPVDSR